MGICYICKGPGCNQCGLFSEGALSKGYTLQCPKCLIDLDQATRTCPLCGYTVLLPGMKPSAKREQQ